MCNFSTFWCGFYFSAAFIRGWFMCNVFSRQNPWKQFGTLWHVQWKWNLTLLMSKKLFQNVITLACKKTAEFSQTWTIYCTAASINLSVPFVQRAKFGESAAWVDRLIKCGVYTRLYNLRDQPSPPPPPPHTHIHVVCVFKPNHFLWQLGMST